MGQSCHVYPSAPQLVDGPPNPYSRMTPLMCDTIEYNTIDPAVGYFDTAQYCYVPVVPQVIRAQTVILFQTPELGQEMNVWFMRGSLPPDPYGSIGGECAGCDMLAYQTYQTDSKGVKHPMYNASVNTFRLMKLTAGERVWCVPGAPSPKGVWLTNAMAGNNINTCNYFEIEVIEVLPSS